MQRYDSLGRPPVPQARDHVRVPDREEVGEIVDPGKDFGRVYAVGVYFASTGEIAYYERNRVTRAE